MAYTRKSALSRSSPCYPQGICSFIGALRSPLKMLSNFELSGFRCDGLYSQIRAVALLALLFAGHLLVNWRLSQSAQNALAFFAVGLSPYHPAKIAYALCKHGICHFCGMHCSMLTHIIPCFGGGGKGMGGRMRKSV